MANLLSNLITPERIVIQVDCSSKKGILEKLAELIARSDPCVKTSTIFDALIARERLGSTGLGYGVAIPHGRSTALDKAVGACMLTRSPIEFDALDGAPVDIFFAISVPDEATEEHLKILSKLAALFQHEEVRSGLRESRSSSDVYRILTEDRDDSAGAALAN